MRFRPMEGEVAHWLGLGFAPPEGLHGDKRRSITLRYTTAGATKLLLDARSFDKAFALRFSKHRENAVMHLLRPQRLDEALWRNIYAIMVAGRPIYIESLMAFLTAITSNDRTVAKAEAARCYGTWMRQAYRNENSDHDD